MGVIQALSALPGARCGHCLLYTTAQQPLYKRENVVIKLGKMNKLQVWHPAPYGVLLDAGEDGELFLSDGAGGKGLSVGDWVEVFVYLDTEDKLAVTTKTPLGEVGRFSYLKVAAVTQVGAFLDWGLKKDVLVPFNEQKFPMVQGSSYVVYIYLDNKTGRIIASSKIDRYIKSLNEDFEIGEQVALLIESETDLGFKCIVNQTHWGILYGDEIFQSLSVGAEVTGYIKYIREDGKIDLCLQPPGYSRDRMGGIAEKILESIRQDGGFLAMTDKSPPADIYERFLVSKQVFKKALGALYKQRKIALEADGIRLLSPAEAPEKKTAQKKGKPPHQ